MVSIIFLLSKTINAFIYSLNIELNSELYGFKILHNSMKKSF